MTLALISAAAVSAAALSGCGSAAPSEPFEVPEYSVQAWEKAHYSSLAQMSGGAELIVVGVVQSVTPGRTVGEPGATIQFRELNVRVERVLKGAAAQSVVVEEEGIHAGGQHYSLNNSRAAKAGARAVFFLKRKAGEQNVLYRLTNSQSRFFLHGGKVFANTSSELTGFEAELQRLDEAALMATVGKTLS